jgi:hypothetical protein
MLGLLLLDSSKQIFSIIAGTVIAAIFALCIAVKWKSFR